MSLPRHSAVLCALGLVIYLTGHALVGSVPAVGTNQWAAGPALIEARAGATATSLGDGNVLVTGGRGASGPLASVELLTSNGTAVPVAAMSLARAEHTAALLGDTGNILVAGGTTVVATEEGTAEVVTGSVEVFDAAAAVWYPVGSLTHPRAGATAVALPEGRIAIVGGHDASGPVLEIEIYDPAAGAFGPGGAISVPRPGAAVTSTRDGHIVVVGGSVAGVAQATSDIIDPVGGTVATVVLTSPRTGASATTTVEDQVLIAGGSDGTTTLATTEVLDPVTGNSTSGATLSARRTDHRAYLLPHNGGVLLVGGSNADGLVTASELVIPWVNAAQALGPVADPRSKTAGAAGPQDGVFVVAGGSTAAGAASGSSDYFGFATVKTDKDDYAPGEFVTITGGGWQPGETVNLVVREVGTGAADTLLNAVAETDGTFVNDFWAPNESHLGVRFYLTATGAGATAQATFTDGNRVTFSTSAAGLALTAFGTINQNACQDAFVQERQGSNIDNGNHPARVVTLSSTAPHKTFFAGLGCLGASVPSVTIPLNQPAVSFSFRINSSGGPFTIAGAGAGLSGSNNASATVSVSRTLTITGTGAGTGTVTSSPVGINCTIANGTATGVCVAGFSNGAVVTLAATPSAVAPTSAGSTFNGWAGDGTGTTTRVVTIDASKSVNAHFKANQSITFGLLADKVYGDADFSVSATASSSLTVSFLATGQCTVSGTTVHITGAGSCTVTAQQAGDANYNTAPGVPRSFTINQKAASVTPNSASKTYADADPSFSGTLSGFLPGDGVTATYTRTAGETVAGSPYTISATLAPAGVLGNYTVTHNTAAFTITPRPASVTPDVKTKVYGDADPTLTGTLTNFVAADGVTATYARTAGETVAGSPYTISATLAPAGVLGNYAITFNTAAFTITPRPVSVTPDVKTKVYGDADPTLTGTLTNFIAGDGVTATYARTAGETVAGSPYTISATLAPAGGLGNYTITYNTANFTITPRPVSVTPDVKTKVYGDADPTLTGTLTNFIAGDGVTATYARTAGETVAGSPYTISATLAPAGGLGNYTITYNTANFTITPRPVSVTPDVKTKVYGDADPTLTGTLTNFIAGDGVTATYARTAGETVAGSPYTISATLAPAGGLGNYTITYNTANFTITPRPVSVTPDVKTKVYGDADPTLTGTLTNFIAGDGVTATYARTAGETVAGSPYTISATLAPAGGLGNYTITYNTANFTITPRPVSVTPDVKTKVYGDADPTLTGTLTNFIAGDGVTATYARTAGETVAGSPYTISATLAPAGGLGNYTITYNTANFTITPRPVSVTPDVKTKVYGDADPTLTGTLTNFIAGDGVTATYARTAGETVAGSPYTISATLAPAGGLGNYTITYNTANFTITPRPVSVTPDVKTKVYGDADPTLTGTLTNFIAGDGVTATYTRTAGETVAGSPYTISAVLAPAGVLGNYTVTYNTAAFTITPRPVSVTPDVKTKVYGDADPTLTGTLTNFIAGDGVTATYARTAGETVAGSPYTISATLAPAGGLGNYTVTYNTAAFTITPRPVSVTPDVKTKVYGDADPTLTGTLTNFVAADGVTATYARTAGETVAGSPYTISATLAPAGVLGNYAITFNTAAFTITPRPVSVTPDAKTKVYGDADPTLTGTLTNFIAGDGVTATYTRTAGETVAGSPYTISATLAPAGVLGNYAITYNTAAFTITARPASVTPDAKTKVYGDTDPTLTGTLTNFVAADGVTATYARTTGEAVAGSPYTISATLAPAGVLGNYAITYNTAAFTITARPASVTPDAKTKVYGDTDPTLTGTLTNFVAADGVTATYARTTGEAVAGSPYTISATLAPAGVLGNYAITFNTAAFTITARPASVTPDAKTKVYGDADPALTGTLTNFVAADGVTASYARTTGETVAGSPYTISATLAPAGVLSNYAITYNTAALTITVKAASVTPDAKTKEYGAADPALTGTLTGFLAGDAVTAAYSRTAGETVLGSPYTISAVLSPAAVLSNYNVTYNTAAFTITVKTASVTPDAKTKEYGAADPALTGTLTGFLAGDAVTAAYSRTAGETVLGSPYTISAVLSPAAVLSNYNVTYNTAAFTITVKTASVTPDAKTKEYGAADPALTGTLTGFLAGDAVTAAYSRTAGETVLGSPYTISAVLSPAAVLSNYNVTYNTAAFTITVKTASVTPDAKTKEYGAADPALTGTLTGFLAGDVVTAAYSRTAGETVLGSPYTISAVLSPAGVLSNYAIAYNTASFTITPKAASVTPAAKTKVYGEADPALTGTLSGFLAGDAVTAAYSRTVGEPVAGSPYTISATLAPTGVLNNYTISYNTAAFAITKRPATWSTNDNTKILGAADPIPLTTGNAVAVTPGTGFLAIDSVTATYSRAAGETVPGNPYHITATVSAGTGVLNNYTITNDGASFTILYRWDGFLQPINDTAHQTGLTQSRFKAGQTIPAKFVIKNAAGQVVTQATNPLFTRSGNLGACDPNTSPENPEPVTPDAGAETRYSGNYHYNWSTKGLSSGVYKIYAILADGTQRWVDICLTK